MNSRRVSVQSSKHPRYVVWELTLKCDQLCNHCGSRAGEQRPEELSTEQALKVVHQLHEMGTKDVVLIGGEAYLHDGFLPIIKELKRLGIRPMLTTGGMGVDANLAQKMLKAGIVQVSISIDGLQHSHDLIRGKKGSFQAAIKALDALREVGVPIAANTNINRVNRNDLEKLYAFLRGKGIDSWQVQITIPLGRAADRPRMILQPFDLLDIMPRVAALKKQAFEDQIILMPGNNFGYFGPEEALLRSLYEGKIDHWNGCMAGKFVMGIESDGAIKGCPSLQSSDYIGGNIKEQPIQEIWDDSPQLDSIRSRTTEQLWGFCKSCPFATTCMGGCSFSAHALFGRPGNNPYCHFRARSFQKQGLRERLIASKPASGKPFDHGHFELVVESIEQKEPADGEHFKNHALAKSYIPIKNYPDTPEGRKKELAQLVKKFSHKQNESCQSCSKMA